MKGTFLLASILSISTPTLARICNFRIENGTMGHPIVLPMGCDPMHDTTMYTCYNETTVNITQFKTAGCTGPIIHEQMVPAAQVQANCSDMLDCTSTKKYYRTSEICALNAPFGYVNEYAGDLCVESLSFNNLPRSVIRTCDFQSYDIVFDFSDGACSPQNLTTELKTRLNACLKTYPVPTVNNSVLSEKATCYNPQGKSVNTVPENPLLVETQFFSDAACTGQPDQSLLEYAQAFANNGRCITDVALGQSRMESCDTIAGATFELTNHFYSLGCQPSSLYWRTGSVSKGCVNGQRKICVTPFGPQFNEIGKAYVRIENYLSSDCVLHTQTVDQIDEYATYTQINSLLGGFNFSCPNATGTITRNGPLPEPVVYELEKCIPNPDPISQSAIPYVMVYTNDKCHGPFTPSLNPAPSNSNDNGAGVAIGIGVTLGVLVLLGVGCIFYRRSKLRQEQETLQLLTNETDR